MLEMLKNQSSENEDQNEDKYEKRNAVIEELVKSAIDEDSVALYRLCEAMNKNILFRVKFLLGNAMNEMDAEDVTQEVLLSLCKDIRTLREPKAFNKWLNSIIANKTSTFLKAASDKDRALSIEEHARDVLECNVDYLPEDYFENTELRKRLMNAVMKLPERQREAIMLFYFDEFSVIEVAKIMDISHQNVSKYLGLAHEKMKLELQNDMHPASFNALTALVPKSA